MNSCGYCGGGAFDPMLSGVTDRLGVVKGGHIFVKCRQCGSAWLDPLPDPADLKSFYPEVYGLGKSAGSSKGLRKLLGRLELKLWFVPVYRRNARILSSGSVSRGELLDIGCGSGYQAACFKEYGFNVEALDFAEGTEEWMMEAHGIKAYSCDSRSMNDVLMGKKYDVITAFHVIEHMIDPGEFIDGIKAHLKPWGRIFLSMPLADSVQAVMFGKQWGAFREAPRHVNLPSRQGISDLLTRMDLEDVVVRPDHVFYIAGGAFASLSGMLSMTFSYGSGSGAAAAFKRMVGAVLAVSYLPLAFIEVLGRRYSMGLALARRRGA